MKINSKNRNIKLVSIALALVLLLSAIGIHAFAVARNTADAQNPAGDEVVLTSPSGVPAANEIQVGTSSSVFLGTHQVVSSDTSIATVVRTSAAFVEMTGISPGFFTRTHSSTAGVLTSVAFHVVDNSNIVRFTLPANSQQNIDAGDSNVALNVQAYDRNDVAAANQITWESMNPGLVSVNNATGTISNPSNQAGSAVLVGNFTDVWGVNQTVALLVVVDGEGGGQTDSIVLSESSWIAHYEGGQVDVHVTANVAWTVSIVDNGGSLTPWLTYSISEGSGNNRTITLTADGNSRGPSRSATVTVTNGTITRTVEVYQEGFGEYSLIAVHIDDRRYTRSQLQGQIINVMDTAATFWLESNMIGQTFTVEFSLRGQSRPAGGDIHCSTNGWIGIGWGATFETQLFTVYSENLYSVTIDGVQFYVQFDVRADFDFIEFHAQGWDYTLLARNISGSEGYLIGVPSSGYLSAIFFDSNGSMASASVRMTLFVNGHWGDNWTEFYAANEYGIHIPYGILEDGEPVFISASQISFPNPNNGAFEILFEINHVVYGFMSFVLNFN